MKKTLSNFRTLSLLLLAGTGLAACQHGSVVEPAISETVLRNEVKMVRLPFTIKAEDDGTATPSNYTLAGVNLFLRSVEAGHSDVILLDAPEVDDLRIEELASHIRKSGLTYGGVSTLGAAPAPGEITLYVERHMVIPPNCGFWRVETSTNRKNNASEHYGCATTANLGLMVANPRDLIAGQGSGNSTASAVGALYSPAPQAPGPTITMSLDGLANATPPDIDAVARSSRGNSGGSN